MLDDGGDGGNAQGVGAHHVARHGVLEAHAEVALTGGHERIGAVLGTLNDLNL